MAVADSSHEGEHKVRPLFAPKGRPYSSLWQASQTLFV